MAQTSEENGAISGPVTDSFGAVVPGAASRSTTRSSVKQHQIDNLPINGRRVDFFALLTPGVVSDGTFGLLSFRDIPGGNDFMTDGNDATETFYNENAGRTRLLTNISQDAARISSADKWLHRRIWASIWAAW